MSGLVARLIPEFEQWKKRYPAGFEGSLSLPCLRRIQEERGYITDDDITDLTAYLGVPRIQVDEAVAFYTQFTRKPLGTHHIQVCHNVSCSLRGAEGLVAHLCTRLGIKPGETTGDGKFTLTTVECLASCGTAPMMMVGNTYHENLTPASVDALLEELAK
ncbi:MAG: NADH-quinone oxidoreductase subunit NuoE [Gemmatimonadaceae bacterium]|nr:NADH-quinone oxidoreductase subunit NuoE [Gemmatimonadaceae bacterium]MCC6431028.1 NADH-quinone oxidoreductase subunit NuoE [Gemmatimonadaceae bacterium]